MPRSSSAVPRALRSGPAPRLVVLLTVLVAVLVALAGSLRFEPAHATAAGPATEPTPLRIHLDSMTPVVPAQGHVTFTGTVTNDSLETWTDINILAFGSATPILDPAALATSATIAEDAYVGDRVTTPGTYDTVPILAPGESADFRLRVPVTELAMTEPGVYWTGVHASGINSLPRDDFADGRARTFIPVVAKHSRPIDTAVVVPLRGTVWYDDDGRLAGLDRWAAQLSDGGRLDRVLDLGEAAGDTAFTWLVDPAMLDAVSRLAAGNPPRSLAPDPAVPEQEPAPSPTEGEETTEPPETPTTGVAPGEDLSEQEQQVAALAAAWLARATPLLGARPVLALPYGDIDVSAAAVRGPEFLQAAEVRSEQTMAGLAIPSAPAVAPEDGVLSSEGLSALSAATTVLLSDTAFTVPPTSPTSRVRLMEHEAIVTSSGAGAGGPTPTRADDPLAMRQRLLSEAALRVLVGSQAPVVVMLPTRWQPADPSAFFDALTRHWLRPVEVGVVAQGIASVEPGANLAYTDEDHAAELGAEAFDTARAMLEAASVTERALSLQTTIEAQVGDEALVSLSSQHRRARTAALRSAESLLAALRANLDLIRVEAPRAVTLTSDSGPLGLTLVNGLDQPVSVAIVATSDGNLRLTGPGTRRLAPRSRTLVRLTATTDRPGIHEVTLRVTTPDGTPLGQPESLPIRASQVSEVIWWMMGGGAAILFSAILMRLWRRVRRNRSASGAGAVAAAVAAAGPTTGEDA